MTDRADTKRELWATAYRFYQDQCKMLEGWGGDRADYFTELAGEIAKMSKDTDAEGVELLKGIYGMLVERSKRAR